MAVTSPPATELQPFEPLRTGNDEIVSFQCHQECNLENKSIQKKLDSCQKDFRLKSETYGECKGELRSACNIALTSLDKTTSHTFCENQVARNSTAAALICTSVNNDLNSCQQASSQRLESFNQCRQNLTALQLDNQALKLNQEHCQQQQEHCQQDQNLSASISAELKQFQQQSQEQFQKQQQEQKQSTGLGLGLGGAGAVLIGAGVYACGRYQGKKEGYKNAMKEMGKQSKSGQRALLNKDNELLRRSLHNSQQNSPALSRHDSRNSITRV